MEIIIQSVSKTYTTAQQVTKALCGVDLTVHSGEFLAVLGPSGSGKSTLLEIVAGLTVPTEGQVLVNGKPINGPAQDRAIIFQEYALFPWRTVLGNLHYSLEVQRFPRSEWNSRCMHYLRMVQLWKFRNVYPGQLSGGMKQRVALARALIGEPQILLMDEPFAAVDAITRYQLQLMLCKIIQKSGKTVLFVTHSIEEALILADRIAILTAPPGRVRETIEVPKSLRGNNLPSAQMFELREHIWSLLEAELMKSSNELDHKVG